MINGNNKPEVWIFGDSFTTEFYTNYLGKIYTNTWPYMIKNNYTTYNPSLCGVGPHTMINLLLNNGKKTVTYHDTLTNKNYYIKNDNNTKTEDITVLFFFSSIMRVNYEFLKVIQHQSVMLDFNHDITNQYQNYKDKVDFLHKYYFTEKWAENNILYIVFTLLYLTKIFKKILVFPIFENEYHYILNWYKYFFKKNMPENLHIVDFCLHANVRNHNKISSKTQADLNPNHLLEDKHIHMYNFLNEYITRSTLNYSELNNLKI